MNNQQEQDALYFWLLDHGHLKDLGFANWVRAKKRFDRWHAAEIAAAEQRGTEKAVQVIRKEAKDAVDYP